MWLHHYEIANHGTFRKQANNSDFCKWKHQTWQYALCFNLDQFWNSFLPLLIMHQKHREGGNMSRWETISILDFEEYCMRWKWIYGSTSCDTNTFFSSDAIRHPLVCVSEVIRLIWVVSKGLYSEIWMRNAYNDTVPHCGKWRGNIGNSSWIRSQPSPQNLFVDSCQHDSKRGLH